MATRKLIKSMNNLVLGVLSVALGIYLLTSDHIVSNDIATGAGGRFAQAGTYVDLLAMVLIGLAVILIVKSFNFTRSEETTGFIFHWNKEILITAVALVVYTFLLPRLGFTFTTFPLLFLLVAVFAAKEVTKGERKLTRQERRKILLLASVFSVAMLVVVFLVFTVLLKTTLP